MNFWCSMRHQTWEKKSLYNVGECIFEHWKPKRLQGSSCRSWTPATSSSLHYVGNFWPMKLGSPWQNPGSAPGCQGHPDENCHLDILTTTKQLYHKLPACLLSFGTMICFAFKINLKFITAKELNALFIASVFLQKSCVAHIVPYVCLRIVVDNYLQLLTQFACFFLVRKIQFSELNNYIWSKWDCFTFTCSLPQSFAIFHVIVKGSWSVSTFTLYPAV